MRYINTRLLLLLPKSRTDRHRKTKIGTEVAHVTHDSDTTFNVKRLKVKLQGRGLLWWPPAQIVLAGSSLVVRNLGFYRASECVARRARYSSTISLRPSVRLSVQYRYCD